MLQSTENKPEVHVSQLPVLVTKKQFPGQLVLAKKTTDGKAIEVQAKTNVRFERSQPDFLEIAWTIHAHDWHTKKLPTFGMTVRH
jgi:hypothetical protein